METQTNAKNNLVVEGNRLIAGFMGAALRGAGCVYDSTCLPDKDIGRALFLYTDLKYDSSWDWLMPVVEKIQAMQNWNVTLGGRLPTECTIYDDDYKHTASGKRINKLAETLKLATWLAVIDFIKWYNSQSPIVP